MRSITQPRPMIGRGFFSRREQMVAGIPTLGKHGNPGRSGFTIIELVTVIVILGVISIVTVGPTLTYLDSMRNRAASGRIVSDIRYMQRMSLSSGLRSWVTFTVASNSYQMYIEDRNNLGKINRIAVTDPMLQSTSPIEFGTSPFVNVAISSVDIGGTAELEFDALGKPYNGSSVALSSVATISLSSGVSVSIQPVSGYAERAG